MEYFGICFRKLVLRFATIMSFYSLCFKIYDADHFNNHLLGALLKLHLVITDILLTRGYTVFLATYYLQQ